MQSCLLWIKGKIKTYVRYTVPYPSCTKPLSARLKAQFRYGSDSFSHANKTHFEVFHRASLWNEIFLETRKLPITTSIHKEKGAPVEIGVHVKKRAKSLTSYKVNTGFITIKGKQETTLPAQMWDSNAKEKKILSSWKYKPINAPAFVCRMHYPWMNAFE